MAAKKKTKSAKTFTSTREVQSANVTIWDPKSIRAAEVAAEAGNFFAAASFCEALGADGWISGVLGTRIGALLGKPWAHEPNVEVPQIMLDFEADWLTICPETTEKRMKFWAFMLGFALIQKVWVEKNGRLLPTLRVKNPRYVRKDMKTGQWFYKIQGEKATEEIEIFPNEPGSPWLLYVPSGDYDRPWLNGLYRSLGLYFLLKLAAIRDWGQCSERWGIGIFLVEAASDAPELKEPGRKLLVEKLSNLGHRGNILMPEGHSLKVLESTARTHESFERQIATSNLGMSVAILGNNLTVQATSGTGNSATVAEGVSAARFREDNEVDCTFQHDFVVGDWAEDNYGDRELAPWPRRDLTGPAERQAQAAELQSLSQAITPLLNAGVLTKDEARTYLRLKPLPATDTSKVGQIFAYHIQNGIVTVNEVRASLGLPPIPDGDRPATPVGATPAEVPA